MTSRRVAKVLRRSAMRSVNSIPALRRVPWLHAAFFFPALLAPLAVLWALIAAGLVTSGVFVLALAAVSLGAFAAIPAGGLAQALAATAARQAWEGRPGTIADAWRSVRLDVNALVWRGLGPDGLFGGRDVADRVYADLLPPQDGPRLFGRRAAVTVVLVSLLFGLPVSLLLADALGAAGDPATAMAASFVLGVGASLALALYGGGILGILGAVAAAAQNHAAVHGTPAPGFPEVRSRKQPPARTPVRFARA